MRGACCYACCARHRGHAKLTSEYLEKIAPSIYLPRGLGQGIVPASSLLWERPRCYVVELSG